MSTGLGGWSGNTPEERENGWKFMFSALKVRAVHCQRLRYILSNLDILSGRIPVNRHRLPLWCIVYAHLERSVSDMTIWVGTETTTAVAIKKSGIPREEIWITTKLQYVRVL